MGHVVECHVALLLQSADRKERFEQPVMFNLKNTLSIALAAKVLIYAGLGLADEKFAPEPRRCLPLIQALGENPDLRWIRSGLRVRAMREKIKPEEIDLTQAVGQLPKMLRESLAESDAEGYLVDKTDKLRQLRNWADREIKERVLNLTRAPEGLRQFDLWVHDKNGSEGGFAIRQLLKPDVGYFGVGHGNAGGEVHVIYPFTVKGEPIIEVQIDVDKMIETYSKLPGVRSSRFIFYKTCSGGLRSEEGEPDAVRLAKASGVPVIAPMGVLVNSGNVIEGKKRQWETSVETEETEKRLPKNKAFRIFMPDGTSKSLSFKKLKELIIRDEFHSRVIYTEDD